MFIYKQQATAVIFFVILCHFCYCGGGALPADLDTSLFAAETDYEYEYDSDPYFLPNPSLESNSKSLLNTALMEDPWTLDFRRKLASKLDIGKKKCFFVFLYNIPNL
jgi:hypothetical protein